MPISEPESTPEPKTEPEAEIDSAETEPPWAEPEPEWDQAFLDWGPAWEVHVFLFASVYLVVACLTVFSMFHFLTKCRTIMKFGSLTLALQILLLLFTSLRSLTLFLEPYATTGRLPGLAYSLLWSLALPGLTASFSVLLLVLLDTTKMTLGPPRFQKLSVILAFTGLHFLVVLVSTVAYVFCRSCKAMLLFCQVLFILYGALLGVGYAYTGYAIHRNCSASGRLDNDNSKTRRLSTISALASAVSFSISVTYIYAASGVFGLYSDVDYVGAWEWWIFQTVVRLEEVFACIVVLAVAKRNPFQNGGCCCHRSAVSPKHPCPITTELNTTLGGHFKTVSNP